MIISTQAFRAHGFSVSRYQFSEGESIVLSRDGYAVAQALVRSQVVLVTGKAAAAAAEIIRAEVGEDCEVKEVTNSDFLMALGSG